MSNNEQSWAVITGASSGIGKCMAIELASRGYNVIVTARRESRLTDLCQLIAEKYGREAKAVPNDLSNPEGAKMLVDEINKLGIKPSILINNAGKGHFGPFTEFSLEDHQGDIQLNISSLVSLTYQMIPLLEQAKGPLWLKPYSAVRYNHQFRQKIQNY